MCNKKELSFSIFMIYSLADKWKMSPAKVYKILNSTGILDDYIIKCYDVLHTQGKEYYRFCERKRCQCMIVYHGSTEIIKNPDVVHSKKYLDFGRGFYITTFENQAKKWAVAE